MPCKNCRKYINITNLELYFLARGLSQKFWEGKKPKNLMTQNISKQMFNDLKLLSFLKTDFIF